MPRPVFFALIGLMILAAGCRSAAPRDLAVEYRPGIPPETFKAPYDATYHLFLIDENGVIPTPIDRAAVERRYHVGFVREPDGTLVAYAAGRKIPLPEGHYRWQITPETHISQGGVCAWAGLSGRR